MMPSSVRKTAVAAMADSIWWPSTMLMSMLPIPIITSLAIIGADLRRYADSSFRFQRKWRVTSIRYGRCMMRAATTMTRMLTAAAATVPTAAPRIPIFGKPNFPKIRMKLITKLVMTEAMAPNRGIFT